MKIKLFISLLALMTSPFVFSQDRGGNGGDAIICHEDGKTTVEVKDYWEYSQMINNLKIDLGPGRTYKEKVEFALNRLKKVDQVRAEKLFERFYDPSFISFVSRGQIPVVDDSPSYLKVDGDKYCNEVQVAFQILNPKQFQSKVLIDKTIFMQFDEVNKAGLILHELIYEQDIKYNNAKDSDIIRWFNYIISSDIMKIFDDVKNGKSQKYADLISEHKIDYFGYDSVPNLRPTKEERKEGPEQEKVVPVLLPTNFAIVSGDDENMVIDIEDDVLHLNRLDLEVVQRKDVSYELQKDFQRISGEFLYRFGEEEWSVSSVETSKGREYSLKLNEKSVIALGLEVAGDLVYSMNSLNQHSFSGVESFRFGSTELICQKECKVSWDEKETPGFQGVFKYKGADIQYLRETQFSFAKPIEYKVKGRKGFYTQHIQRAELTKKGMSVFIMIQKGESEVQLQDQSYSFEKCEQSSCSYRINL